jgi:hypothetical protein
MLVWRGEATAVPVSARRIGIAVLPTVGACLDALIEADKPGPGRGFVERLRSLLGLRTSASVSSG